MLTADIPKMVKSIENSTEVLVAKIKEEERQAELRRQEWAAQEEQWRQEEDRRHVAESIRESRVELAKAIEGWAKAVSLEQFFSGVQSRAQDLRGRLQQDKVESETWSLAALMPSWAERLCRVAERAPGNGG